MERDERGRARRRRHGVDAAGHGQVRRAEARRRHARPRDARAVRRRDAAGHESDGRVRVEIEEDALPRDAGERQRRARGLGRGDELRGHGARSGQERDARDGVRERAAAIVGSFDEDGQDVTRVVGRVGREARRRVQFQRGRARERRAREADAHARDGRVSRDGRQEGQLGGSELPRGDDRLLRESALRHDELDAVGRRDRAARRAEHLPALELVREREQPDVFVARVEEDLRRARAGRDAERQRPCRAGDRAAEIRRGERRMVEDEVRGERRLVELALAAREDQLLVEVALHREAAGPRRRPVGRPRDDARRGAARGRDDGRVERDRGRQRRNRRRRIDADERRVEVDGQDRRPRRGVRVRRDERDGAGSRERDARAIGRRAAARDEDRDRQREPRARDDVVPRGEEVGRVDARRERKRERDAAGRERRARALGQRVVAGAVRDQAQLGRGERRPAERQRLGQALARDRRQADAEVRRGDERVRREVDRRVRAGGARERAAGSRDEERRGLGRERSEAAAERHRADGRAPARGAAPTACNPCARERGRSGPRGCRP